jgi:hypothetical protein
MQQAPHHMNPRLELAARESNSISVRLLWARWTNVVTVTVADLTNGNSFELVLGEHDRALDVFHHPYAYAAARGIEFGAFPDKPEVLADAA